jgi:hypothetical protein
MRGSTVDKLPVKYLDRDIELTVEHVGLVLQEMVWLEIQILEWFVG